MGHLTRRFALAALLAGVIPLCGQAQELLPSDWPTHFRDSANTVSTPVLLTHTLNVLWEAPSPGGRQAPRAYLTGTEKTLVIAGNCVYDAWSGNLEHYLPDAGDRAAITTLADGTDVLLAGRQRDDMHNSGFEFFAYELDESKDYPFLWYLDSLTDLNFDTYMEINAKDGFFYVTGVDVCSGIAKIDGATGTVVWEKLETQWPVGGKIEDCAVASVEVDPLTGAREDAVFLSLHGGGLVALHADDGAYWWHVAYDSNRTQPCVDETAGIVYGATHLGGYTDYTLRAYDTATGQEVWIAPLDHILNGPPTLGWAKDSEDVLQPAVFAVTGGMDGQAGVFAYHRSSGALLWFNSLPSDAWSSAVYSGCSGPEDDRPAKLYIAANNGFTYVLDAFSGNPLQILATDFNRGPGQYCPVIVDVDGESVLYFMNNAGNVAAWTQLGTNPQPDVFHLSMQVEPSQIGINSSATVSAKLIDGDLQPIGGATVTFSCDAEKNQGYVDPTAVKTDATGKATTTFYSQNRTGVVTLIARTSTTNYVIATISVVRNGGEEPPPQTGTIQGQVFGPDGKPVKRASVTATNGGGSSWQTTSSPKDGTYKLADLPAGTYMVEGFKEGVGYDMAGPFDLQAGATEVVDLYLEP